MIKYLIGLVVISVIIFAAYLYKGRLVTTPISKNTVVEKSETAKIDKNDPKWLEKYCKEEVKKLPPAPFKYTGLEGDVHMLVIPDVSLKSMIPQDKFQQATTCSLWYKFDPKEAYASLGVESLNDIKLTIKFEENADRVFSAAIDKSWHKEKSLSDEEGGRPSYGYKGFPLIFTRENTDLNTVEFATAEFGANEFFTDFVLYEK